MNTRAIDSGRAMRLALVLIAALALVVAGLSGPSAGASGGNTASAAKKKKCKKGYHKVVVRKNGKIVFTKSGKKKKKCVKNKAAVVPVVRATLRWDTDPAGQGANLDLYVFDAAGVSANPASNPIPNSLFSATDTNAPGIETFTDLAPQTHRVFSFGVCYGPPDIGSVHATGTIVYVTADGVSHTGSFDLGSKGGHKEFPVDNPSATYCS